MPLNESINACVTVMPTLTPTTAEPMSNQAVDLGSTALAVVGQAQGNHQAKTHVNRMVSPFICSPIAESGSTFNQAPDPVLSAASKRACDLSFAADSSNFLKVATTLGLSKLFWHIEAVADGGNASCPFQTFKASLCKGMGASLKWGGRSWLIRGEEPAAEAKKAEGASWVTLRIPSPLTKLGGMLGSKLCHYPKG